MLTIIDNLINSIRANFPDLADDEDSIQYEWIKELEKLRELIHNKVEA